MTTTQTSSTQSSSQLSMVGHKDIGRILIGSSVLVLFAALIAGAAAAFEASDLAMFDVFQNSDQFRQIWSAAREGIVLGAVLPGLVGLAVYLAPLQVGANGLAFEKGAAAGYWTWLMGLILLVASYVMDGGPSGEREDFVVLWMMATGLMALGMIWALASVAATLLTSRAQGMTLAKAPISAWGFLVFAFAGSFVMATHVAELIVSYVRVSSGHLPIGNTAELLTVMSPYIRSASALVVLVPVLGIMSEVVAVHSGRAISDTRPAMVPIGFLGFLAAIGGSAYFTTVRLVEPVVFHSLIAAGSLACIASIWAYLVWKIVKGGSFTTPGAIGGFLATSLASLAALVMLVDLASVEVDALGLEPLSLSTVSQDLIGNSLSAAEALYAFGPMFALIIGSSLIALYTGVLHWSVKIWGRHLGSAVTIASSLLTAAGAVLWAVGQIVASQELDAVELSVDAAENSGEWFALLPLAGIAAMALASFLMIANIASLATRKVAGSTSPKWEGLTLEWATASPPVRENFPSAPVVKSAVPLTEEVFVLDAPEIESGSDSEQPPMPELEAGAV